MSLTPIQLPAPEEPTNDTKNEEEVKRKEGKLRNELLQLVFSGSFKYSKRVIGKANLEQLEDIQTIFEQQRRDVLLNLWFFTLPYLLPRVSTN